MRRPLVAALALFVLHLSITLAIGARLAGRFSYPIDDAYIHLSIARHLATAPHVYGVTPFAYVSASSSIVWPFLLAFFFPLLGAHAALALAASSAALLLWVSARALSGVSVAWRTAGLLAIVFAAPLAALAASGMEHALHASATVALVAYAAKRDRHPRALVALSFLCASIRYEGAIVAGIVALSFLLPRPERAGVALALSVVAAAALPIVLAGGVHLAHGLPFVPLSVLMKRASIGGDLVSGPIRRLAIEPTLAALLLLEAAAFASLPRSRRLTGVAFVATVAHVVLADVGWLFRYEAYLVVLGIVAVVVALDEAVAAPRRVRMGVFALAALVAIASSRRGIAAAVVVPRAMANVAAQQGEIARFVASGYAGRGVALNDIGAVTYASDVHLTDLIGLGSPDVARARGYRIGGWLTKDEVTRLANEGNAEIAIVYDAWFGPVIPDAWRAVERWTIPDNKICAFDTVTFYATSPERVPGLEAKLRGFTTIAGVTRSSTGPR